MLLLLSPAKSLNFETPAPKAVLKKATQPLFTAQAATLIQHLQKKSASQVAALMDLSPALASLNVERYAAWVAQPLPAASKPAVLAFDGDVYGGLDASSLGAADLNWAQKHLVILSGLYGALRPLDHILPHRLEMGTALKTAAGNNLYAHWGEQLAEHLNERLADARTPTVVNLASVEYAQAALRPSLKARVIECRFEDWKDGRYKVISFFAKRARGLMARHAITSRATSPAALRGFTAQGYALDAPSSTPQHLVFQRRV
jgi:uncharacterized protein